jgi:hypothetical protein
MAATLTLADATIRDRGLSRLTAWLIFWCGSTVR